MERGETGPETAAIPGGRPDWTDNWTLGAGLLRMELMHPASRSVWLAQEPVTDADFDALAPPDGFVKSGIGRSVADAAYFRRSPGAERDGPLETRVLGGLRFSRVARPGAPEPGFPGVLVLPVFKHHVVLYRAGRPLDVMSFGDGFDYVPLVAEARGVGGAARRAAGPLPGGWSRRTLRLERDLVVELPNPARVAFFPDGDSFQGPVRLELP
jgi:hypothetical protein